ncbi:MAG: DUF177 domain-containing protein [Gemmatimonadetes bacterium]|nr:DUF177 domain-containing protein [Gemmatimonadota bacterium]MDA1103816.1 DUF177 domain-containing protein [Gemmatimonadota bacterium]
MLRVDLGQLGREGSAIVAARLSPTDDLWTGTDLPWTGDIEIDLQATNAGTGEIVVRGSVTGELRQECKRCLKPLNTPFRSSLVLVFVSDVDPDDEDVGGYTFEPRSAVLDLGSAVREEVVLAMNPYVVCDPGCRGLCSTCGTNLNEGECDCVDDETDPRWATLRNLKDE